MSTGAPTHYAGAAREWLTCLEGVTAVCDALSDVQRARAELAPLFNSPAVAEEELGEADWAAFGECSGQSADVNSAAQACGKLTVTRAALVRVVPQQHDPLFVTHA
jgi:hypothetical protein